MGLLDDAIREHLSLKRRRGADPGEIERAEREALGPVRRRPELAEQVESDSDEPLAYDHEAEQEWAEPFEDAGDEPEFPAEGHSEPFDASAESFAPPEPPRGEEHPSRWAQAPREESADFEDPVSPEEPFAGRRGGGTPPPHAAPAEHRGDENVEYDIEAGLEEEERDQHADDMLEETPDFLHDTPDHDRLWFEQRPPRDFDFDG